MKQRLLLILLFVLVMTPMTAGQTTRNFKVTVDTPREFFIPDPANNTRKPFWVVTFRLENTTGEDRELALRSFLETDYKRVDQERARVGNVLHGPLQKIVQQKDGRVYKNIVELSLHPFRREEVVDGIFIFPRPPRRSDNIELFVDGLSAVRVKKETSDNLDKLKKDFIRIVKPEIITWNKQKETRFRPFTKEDFDAAEGTTFRERLLYRKGFTRKGDEFHVHEDDIKAKVNERNNWVLVLDRGSR